MSRYITIANFDSRSSMFPARKRRKTVGATFKTGPVTLAIVTVVVVCMVGFFFLAQVFDSSTKGLEISSLRRQAEDLRKENTQMASEAARLKSFQNIEEEAKKLNLVGTNHVVYLSRTDTGVATAR